MTCCAEVGSTLEHFNSTILYRQTGQRKITQTSGFLNYDTGNFILEFETTSFPKAGTYSFQITAELDTYETQQLSITVDINIINTTLTATATVIDITPGKSRDKPK